MNYKAVLGVLGVAIVVGGIIYFVTRNEFVKSSEELERDEKKSTDIGTHASATEDEDQSNLDNVKANAAEAMRERHEEAQKEMRKSVDSIFNGAGSEETKNEEAKKKIFEDLDNI